MDKESGNLKKFWKTLRWIDEEFGNFGRVVENVAMDGPTVERFGKSRCRRKFDEDRDGWSQN